MDLILASRVISNKFSVFPNNVSQISESNFSLVWFIFFQKYPLPPIPFTIFIHCVFMHHLYDSHVLLNLIPLKDTLETFPHGIFWLLLCQTSPFHKEMRFMVREGTSNLYNLLFLRCIKQKRNQTFKIETWSSNTMTPYCQAKTAILWTSRQHPAFLYILPHVIWIWIVLYWRTTNMIGDVFNI